MYIFFPGIPGHFGLQGKTEDYYYLNQSGVYTIDGKDDKKDYKATRVRNNYNIYMLFCFIHLYLPCYYCYYPLCYAKARLQRYSMTLNCIWPIKT